MPDTGAPWNIPYVAASDLVKDWPTDNQQQAEAIADVFTAVSVGIGSNIVQAVKTDSFTSTSTTYTGVTGLSVTITPSTNTSKVLLIASVSISNNHANVNQANFFRITGGNIGTNYQGDAAGSRERVWTSVGYSDSTQLFSRTMTTVCGIYLDSPATTSATTYQIEGRREGATNFVVNRTPLDGDAAYVPRGVSSITAIEVYA